MYYKYVKYNTIKKKDCDANSCARLESVSITFLWNFEKEVSLCSVAATMYFKMFPDGRGAVPTYVLIEVSGSEQVLSVFILRKKN